MNLEDALEWLEKGMRRKMIVMKIRQPMTAKQLSRHVGLSIYSCAHALRAIQKYELLECLNETATKGRVFWLTELGKLSQDRLRKSYGYPPASHDFPNVDWNLYGWASFRHRSAIIKTLDEPLQPTSIKRAAIRRDPELRMSANNVRDAIRLLRVKGIVRAVKIGNKPHLRYKLTDLGEKLRALLNEAEAME